MSDVIWIYVIFELICWLLAELAVLLASLSRLLSL
jgi:hypothetical protein